MQFILNADDFGRTETANKAITYGFQNGYLSRTTIMVNMPYYEEAKALAKQYGFYDKIGLHINLVSGEPLTEGIKECRNFTNENGRFNGKIFKNKKLWFFLSKKEKRAIRAEVEAQIKRYLDDGFTLLHADSHGHTHTFWTINKIVISLLKKHQFRSVRICRNLGVTGYLKIYKFWVNTKNKKFNKKRNNVCKYFGACADVMKFYDEMNGVCEVMMHPNFYDGMMLVEEKVTYENLCLFIKNKGGEIV